MSSGNAPNLNGSREEITPEVKVVQPRLTVDTINSSQLDALYDRIATLKAVAAGNKRHVQLIVPELENCDAARRALRGRLERAEAAITRVRALHRKATHGDTCVYCAPGQRIGYDTTWPCDTIRALADPSGPAAIEPARSAPTTGIAWSSCPRTDRHGAHAWPEYPDRPGYCPGHPAPAPSELPCTAPTTAPGHACTYGQRCPNCRD